jgi:hypothetical protein
MTVKGNLFGKFEKQIRDMKLYEEGYTIPSAIILKPEGDGFRIYLNIAYPVFPKAQGSAELYVKKTGSNLRNENYLEIDLDTVKSYKWKDVIGLFNERNDNPSDIVSIGHANFSPEKSS